MTEARPKRLARRCGRSHARRYRCDLAVTDSKDELPETYEEDELPETYEEY